MRFLTFLILLTIMLLTATTFAQSPYREYSATDNIILGASLAGGLGALHLDKNIEPLTEQQIAALDRDNINRFDRPATYNNSTLAADISDWGLRLCLAAPLAFMADAKMRNDAWTIGRLYLETMAVAGVATELTKVSVRRIRPYAYNPDVSLHDKMARDTRKSFFSGHTSISFAGAVFFAKVFGDYYPESRWRPYVWAGSLTLSSVVAYARVSAGRHFPTDVIVGALVGGAVGYFIPELHKKSAASFSVANSPDRPLMLGVTIVF